MARRNYLPRLFIIPITPKPASRPRFSRQGRVYTDPAYRTWLQSFTALMKDLWDQEPLDHVQHIEIQISGPSKRGDIDNHVKSILDGLQYANVLRSDNLKVVDSISASFFSSDKSEPFIMIKIFD